MLCGEWETAGDKMSRQRALVGRRLGMWGRRVAGDNLMTPHQLQYVEIVTEWSTSSIVISAH